jgi:hypothetical protein
MPRNPNHIHRNVRWAEYNERIIVINTPQMVALAISGFSYPRATSQRKKPIIIAQAEETQATSIESE